MKYVRVIDDSGNEYLTTYKEHCEMVAELQDSGFDFEGGILKQADTIPELCDVLIIKTKDYRGFKGQLKTVDLRVASGTKEDLHDYLVSQMRSELFEFAFLGIETDKGLIYVAKMNENKDLELMRL